MLKEMQVTYEKQLTSLRALYAASDIFHRVLLAEEGSIPVELEGPTGAMKATALGAVKAYAEWIRALQEHLNLIKGRMG